MNPHNDNWATTYSTLFGRALSGAEISAWSNEIRDAFEGRTKPWPGETAKAVRAMASTWPTDDGKGNRNQYAPTCRDLISAMKDARRRAFEQAGGHTIIQQRRRTLPNGEQESYSASVVEITGDWQEELRQADPLSRWAIICRPASNDQCREREVFCERNRLPFERFTPQASYVGTIGQNAA